MGNFLERLFWPKGSHMIIEVPLKWNAVLGTDVVGYQVSWGPVNKKPVGRTYVPKDVTALTLAVQVPPKTTYMVSVSSYDVSGNYSSETPLTAVYVDPSLKSFRDC